MATVEALPMTKPPEYIDGHPLRGCWARWIDKNKERKRKGSSWV